MNDIDPYDPYDFDEEDVLNIDNLDFTEESTTAYDRFTELNFNNPTAFNEEDYKYFLNYGEE